MKTTTKKKRQKRRKKPERKTLVAATRTRPRQCHSASADVYAGEWVEGWRVEGVTGIWNPGAARPCLFVCLFANCLGQQTGQAIK